MKNDLHLNSISEEIGKPTSTIAVVVHYVRARVFLVLHRH